jgi:hypothetical protein
MIERTLPAVLALLGLAAVPLAAQPSAPAKAESKAIPRMPDGHPDMQGVWQHPYVPDMTQDREFQKGAGPLPFTPEGAANFKNYDVSKFDYTGHCLPFGLLRSMNVGGYPVQIMQNSKYLSFLFEQNTWFHVVYMDGRGHPAKLDPTWFGHSIGRWDGDTLVVDTVGFNGLTRLDTLGHPHSDAMHVTQTFSYTDTDHLTYVVTVDDPKNYTRPWSNTRTFWRLKPGEELIEYSCEENNRDFTQGHIK